MDNVNWLKLKLNQKMANLKSANTHINTESAPKNNVAKNLVQQTQNNIINNIQRNFVNPQQLRMNNLASIDRSIYIKEVLNLPKNMVELFVMVQNEGKASKAQQPQQMQQPQQTQPQQNTQNPQAPQQPQQSQQIQQTQSQQNQQTSQNNQNSQQQNQQLPNQPQQTQLPHTKFPDLSDLIGKQPVRPDIESQPNQPQKPSLPPQQPNLPNVPNQPNRPNPLPQPNQPNLPQISNRHEQGGQKPNTPSLPNQPQQPSLPPQQPNLPNVPNQPNRPNPLPQPNQPNLPHFPNRSENGGLKPHPPTENKPNQPFPPKGEFEDSIKNSEDMMNRRQDMIQDRMKNTLPDTSRFNDKYNNIRNTNLRNPHNQLHNQVRNNIRNNPNILREQIMQDSEAVDDMQTNQKTQGMTAEELTAFKQKLASQLDSNVNISRVSNLLQRNSKLAMNKMVTMMSLATSKGMGDITPLQDTINIINASVSATSQNDATQTLKNLMLLYLPWLPLQEGVGFDLEIEQDKEEKQFDTFIKIMITTVNYGNVNAVVSLVTGNSVDISITCSEKFPKEKLLKKLQNESKQYSMQSVIDFKKQSPQEQIDTETPKAKVNLSNVNDVNPYLLLISHAIIRYTIELDATLTIGAQPIED